MYTGDVGIFHGDTSDSIAHHNCFPIPFIDGVNGDAEHFNTGICMDFSRNGSLQIVDPHGGQCIGHFTCTGGILTRGHLQLLCAR